MKGSDVEVGPVGASTTKDSGTAGFGSVATDGVTTAAGSSPSVVAGSVNIPALPSVSTAELASEIGTDKYKKINALVNSGNYGRECRSIKPGDRLPPFESLRLATIDPRSYEALWGALDGPVPVELRETLTLRWQNMKISPENQALLAKRVDLWHRMKSAGGETERWLNDQLEKVLFNAERFCIKGPGRFKDEQFIFPEATGVFPFKEMRLTAGDDQKAYCQSIKGRKMVKTRILSRTIQASNILEVISRLSQFCKSYSLPHNHNLFVAYIPHLDGFIKSLNKVYSSPSINTEGYKQSYPKAKDFYNGLVKHALRFNMALQPLSEDVKNSGGVSKRMHYLSTDFGDNFKYDLDELSDIQLEGSFKYYRHCCDYLVRRGLQELNHKLERVKERVRVNSSSIAYPRVAPRAAPRVAASGQSGVAGSRAESIDSKIRDHAGVFFRNKGFNMARTASTIIEKFLCKQDYNLEALDNESRPIMQKLLKTLRPEKLKLYNQVLSKHITDYVVEIQNRGRVAPAADRSAATRLAVQAQRTVAPAGPPRVAASAQFGVAGSRAASAAVITDSMIRERDVAISKAANKVLANIPVVGGVAHPQVNAWNLSVRAAFSPQTSIVPNKISWTDTPLHERGFYELRWRNMRLTDKAQHSLAQRLEFWSNLIATASRNEIDAAICTREFLQSHWNEEVGKALDGLGRGLRPFAIERALFNAAREELFLAERFIQHSGDSKVSELKKYFVDSGTRHLPEPVQSTSHQNYPSYKDRKDAEVKFANFVYRTSALIDGTSYVIEFCDIIKSQHSMQSHQGLVKKAQEFLGKIDGNYEVCYDPESRGDLATMCEEISAAQIAGLRQIDPKALGVLLSRSKELPVYLCKGVDKKVGGKFSEFSDRSLRSAQQVLQLNGQEVVAQLSHDLNYKANELFAKKDKSSDAQPVAGSSAVDQEDHAAAAPSRRRPFSSENDPYATDDETIDRRIKRLERQRKRIKKASRGSDAQHAASFLSL